MIAQTESSFKSNFGDKLTFCEVILTLKSVVRKCANHVQ